MRRLGALLLEFFLLTLAFSMFTSGAALFAERRYSVGGVPFGPKEVGYIFMYSGFLGIIVQGSLRQGALVRAVREGRLVVCHKASGVAQPLSISESAREGHLGHGDTLGACAASAGR